MRIYFESKNGHTKAFLEEKVLPLMSDLELVQIDENTVADKPGHLVTYTTGKGKTPKLTHLFVEKYKNFILSVSSGGSSKGHPETFGFARKNLVEEFGLVSGIIFNGKGNDDDAKSLFKIMTEQ